MAMLALLLTVRDVLLALALSWIGITFETTSPPKHSEPVKTCGAGESVCTSLTAGFDALECAKR